MSETIEERYEYHRAGLEGEGYCDVAALLDDLMAERGKLKGGNIELVMAEIVRGVELHGNYNSSHEAYAVLLEEVDELWDEIKKRHKDYPAMKKEALQVAAIAIRFCDEIDNIVSRMDVKED